MCKIKAINRKQNSINIGYRIKKTAGSQLMIRLELFKRANGWRPFLYNITLNVCEFFDSVKNKNSPNGMLFSLAFYYINPYLKSPMKCPFRENSTVEIMNFVSDVNKLRTRFPIENGEYAAQFSVYYKRILKYTINGSLEYLNYREY
ncbi:uncharacterized protein LOC111080509 isoform X2 [Drosophila obscura]|nr:uncharacterized protein LOC111080509 isoform X2 [Drosophila obscura]